MQKESSEGAATPPSQAVTSKEGEESDKEGSEAEKEELSFVAEPLATSMSGFLQLVQQKGLCVFAPTKPNRGRLRHNTDNHGKEWRGTPRRGG